MTSEQAASDAGITRALDRLGADAVVESPHPPPLPSPARGRLGRPPRWLAAAVVIVAGVGVTLLATGGNDDAERLHADRTADPADGPRPDVTVSAPAETERADVNIVFRRDPDRPTSVAFIGSVTNDDAQPWSWDCTVGDLFRWDGSTWELVADAAIWKDDGELRLFEHEVGLDCGPPARYLGSRVTEDRAMSPEWDLTGTSTRTLDEPGDYRLVVPDGTGRVAIGRFTIGGAGEPEPDPGAPFPSPPDDPSCTLLSSAELRELTGVDPDDPTGPVHMTPQPCWVGDSNGEASYRIAPLAEARTALEDPTLVEEIGPRPVAGAEESRIARSPSNGRSSGMILGVVVVDGRAAIFSLSGTTLIAADEPARGLAIALAERLAR